MNTTKMLCRVPVQIDVRGTIYGEGEFAPTTYKAYATLFGKQIADSGAYSHKTEELAVKIAKQNVRKWQESVLQE